MSSTLFKTRLARLSAEYEALITRSNPIDPTWNNGVFERYTYPVVTAAHVPLSWRYDLNPASNPYLMERLGINAAFNPGAIDFNGKICLIVRVEGMIVNHSLRLRIVKMELITSVFGRNQSSCQKQMSRTQTYMICVW